MLNGKSVLITGGTGSFGKQFIKTILAKYKDIAFAVKAKTIAMGIIQAKVLSLSIKIFFTAGSNNQAVAAELVATIIESARESNILLKCFLI